MLFVDTLLLIKAAVMGVVEGLTEFLPISSTGHLILTGSLLGMTDERDKVFEVAIQTGAIFAVILVYWQKIRTTLCGLGKVESANRLFSNILIAFAPAVVLGLVFGKVIKAHLFNPLVVASAFIIGGVIIWAVERRPQAQNPDSGRVQSADEVRVPPRGDADSERCEGACRVPDQSRGVFGAGGEAWQKDLKPRPARRRSRSASS